MLRTGILALILIFPISGDLNKDIPEWEIDAPNYIHWLFPTITGTLLFKGNDGIHGIDPETQQVVWSKPEFSRVPMANIRQVEGTPFYEVLGLELPKPTKDEKAKGGLKAMVNNAKDNLERTGAAANRVYVFDPLTGMEIFDSKNLEIESITKRIYLKKINCFLFEGFNGKDRMFGLADALTGQILWVKEKPIKLARFTLNDDLKVYPDPTGDLLITFKDSIFHIEKVTGKYQWSKPLNELKVYQFSGNFPYLFAIANNSILKIDLQNGKVIEEFTPKSDDYPKLEGITNPYEVLQSPSRLLDQKGKLLISGNSGFFLLDPETMKPLLNSSSIFPEYIITNAFIQENGNYFLYLKNKTTGKTSLAVTDSQGKTKWAKPYEIKGERTILLEYSQEGIALITSSAADIINVENGKSKFKSNLSLKPELPVFITQSPNLEKVLYIHDDEVVELDVSKGTSKRIIKNLNFKGDDSDKIPNILESREGGYFIGSNQNLLFINADGTIKYQLYFKRPGMSDKASALFTKFGSLAAGYIFRQQAQQLTQTMYDVGAISSGEYLNIAFSDYYLGGTGSAAQVSNLATKAFSKVSERSAYFLGNSSYMLVLSKLETGGNGFIKVDKDTGASLQEIQLNDKTPTILVDEYLGGMYYVTSDSKKLQFFSLKQ